MNLSLKAIKDKYYAMPQAARAAVLFTCCSILQKGVAFLLTPVYTRIMPPGAYGQYSVFLAWYQLIMIFTTLNMWNYLINNGIIKYGEQRNSFISSLFGLSTALTIVWFIVYLPCSGLWETLTGLSRASMLLMFLELLLMPAFEYFCASKRFDYQAGPVVALSMAITLITPLISVPMILLSGDKGFAAIAGKVIGSSLGYIVAVIYIIRGSRHFFDKEYWLYALKFNLPLIPHFLSMLVLSQCDRIMIDRMCGSDATGMYSVAYQAGMALQVLNAGILSVYVPYTYKSIKAGAIGRIEQSATFLLLLIGMANLFAVLVAPELMRILAPPDYQMAVYVVQPVTMSNLFIFLFNLFANIEYYWNQTKQVAVASIVSAIANIILNYIFINLYGFIAAGYTTLFCYALFSFCHYLFMKRAERLFMDEKEVYDIKKIVGISALLLSASFVLIAFYGMPVVRYAILVISVIIIAVKRNKVIEAIKKALGRENSSDESA